MIRAIVLAMMSVGTLAEEGALLQPRRAQTAAAGPAKSSAQQGAPAAAVARPASQDERPAASRTFSGVPEGSLPETAI